MMLNRNWPPATEADWQGQYSGYGTNKNGKHTNEETERHDAGANDGACVTRNPCIALKSLCLYLGHTNSSHERMNFTWDI